MKHFRADLRHAARSLARSGGFAAAAILTLGLGLGATTAIATLIDAVVLRPLPYADADRLVHLSSRAPGVGEDERWGLSEAGYHHIREQAASLVAVGVMGSGEATVTGDAGAERVRTATVSASLFDVFRLSPAVGRLLREEEERPNAPRAAVLGWDYWQARFGGDPSVIGQHIDVAGVPREIVGVLQAGAHLPDAHVDLWLPAALDPARDPANWHWIQATARMRPDVALAAAQSELDAITARLPELVPSVYTADFMSRLGFWTEARALHDVVVGPTFSRTLWILLAAVALVLLVASANVANLFLVRFEARRREAALRRALGASRGNMASHYLAEALLIAAGGVLLAVLFAHGALQSIIALAPDTFPRLAEVRLTGSAVLAAAGVGAAGVLLLGLLPVLRPAAFSVLRESGRGSTASRSRTRLRSALVASQTALALLLLVAAGLMLESYRQLRAVDLGFRQENTLLFQIPLPASRYLEWDQVFAFHRDLQARLEGIAGVAAVGATNLSLLAEQGCSAVFLEDRTFTAPEGPPCVTTSYAAPGTLAALGIASRGAESTWTEVGSGAGGAVVTRSLAERFWPGEDALGKGIRGNGAQPPYYPVTAVIEDVRLAGVDAEPLQAVLFPFMPKEGAPLWTPPRNATVIVRTDGATPLALVEPVRRVVAGMDPQLPLANVRTLDDAVRRSPSMARARFVMTLLLIAGAMTLALSAIGIYGVIAYVVTQRRAEISVRLALGAQVRAVQAMVMRQALGSVALGIAIGLAAALAGTRALQALLFGVSPTSPVALAGAIVTVLAAGALASFLPVRRAARVDAMEALRME